MANDDSPRILRDDDAERFVLADAPEAARLDYAQSDGRITLLHTEVADDLEGQGVGSALVREALDYAEQAQLTIVVRCRFVAGWLDRHPQRAAELDIAG